MKTERGFINFGDLAWAMAIVGVGVGVLLGLVLPWALRQLGRLFTWLGAVLS
jgi:uncharacterized membrane protein (Fun14 family)